MSRTNIGFMLFTSLVLIITVVTLTPAHQTRQQHQEQKDRLFAEKLAGTFYELSDQAIATDPFKGLHTLTSDGTFIGSNNLCCNPQGSNLQSPFHGIWKRTGPRQITVSIFAFGFNPAGNPDGPSHIWTARIKATVDFMDDDLEVADVTIETLVFGPDRNPLDPDEIPILPDPFVVEGVVWTRAQVIE